MGRNSPWNPLGFFWLYKMDVFRDSIWSKNGFKEKKMTWNQCLTTRNRTSFAGTVRRMRRILGFWKLWEEETAWNVLPGGKSMELVGYCWWFSNPAVSTEKMSKPVVKKWQKRSNELFRWISSIKSMNWFLNHLLLEFHINNLII